MKLSPLRALPIALPLFGVAAVIASYRPVAGFLFLAAAGVLERFVLDELHESKRTETNPEIPDVLLRHILTQQLADIGRYRTGNPTHPLPHMAESRDAFDQYVALAKDIAARSLGGSTFALTKAIEQLWMIQEGIAQEIVTTYPQHRERSGLERMERRT